MTQTQTNANSNLTATVLSTAKVGTFTGLVTTKKGSKVGGLVYGDDTVHVVILTGFKYDSLVERSLAALEALSPHAILDEADTKGLVDGKGNPLTLDAVKAAKMELVASFKRTLEPTVESAAKTVYEPLMVCGEKVRGGRVYKCQGNDKCRCRACTDNPRAPLNGTIYLQGLRVWEKVIEPGENGQRPPKKSAAKTVAKDLMRSKLPVSRYVSYALEPKGSWLLRAGGTAVLEATERGFHVTEDILSVITPAA